jgi:hypothetical protein
LLSRWQSALARVSFLMPRTFETFVADPSRENYLLAREALLAPSFRSLDAAQLDALVLLADAGDIAGLTSALEALPPIAALVPRVHYYAALAAEARRDEEDLELERMLLVICLRALLMTGDGSRESPYVISASSDEYDLLEALELSPVSQSLVHRRGAACDVIACDDGSEIWFDVSALVQIPADAPMPLAVSPDKKAKKRANRRLTRTGR